MAPAMRPAAFLLAAFCCATSVHASQILSDAASVGTYFSYDNAAADATVDLIEQAQRRVLLAGYTQVPPTVASVWLTPGSFRISCAILSVTEVLAARDVPSGVRIRTLYCD